MLKCVTERAGSGVAGHLCRVGEALAIRGGTYDVLPTTPLSILLPTSLLLLLVLTSSTLLLLVIAASSSLLQLSSTFLQLSDGLGIGNTAEA